MLTSLSVDEILLPHHGNLSTIFRGLPIKVEMPPPSPHLKHMKSVLFLFIWRPMAPAAGSRLCSWDLVWAGVFAQSARLFVSVIFTAGYHLLLASFFFFF